MNNAAGDLNLICSVCLTRPQAITSKMKLARRIAKEISDPRDGLRLPGEIGCQRTAILPQTIPFNFSTDGSKDVVLCRDTVFPVWGTTSDAVPVTYSVSWQADNGAVSQTIAADELLQMDCKELCGAWNGSSSGSETRFTSAFSPAVGIPVAVFQDSDDKDPWMWVPVGGTCVIGFSSQTGFTTGNTLNVTAVFERALGPEYLCGELAMPSVTLSKTNPAAGVSSNMATDLPAGSNGCWVRCRRVTFTSAGGIIFAAGWNILVTCCVVSSGLVSLTPSTTTDLPTLSGGTVSSVFLPLVNLDANRSLLAASAVVSRSNRLVGVSCTFENVTSLKDMDGYYTCVAFVESGSVTLAAPPTNSTLGLMVAKDKLTTRMANTIRAFVRPGREISQFQDSRYEFVPVGGVPTNLRILPVMNLYKVACYTLVRCVDSDPTTTTSLLLTLRTTMEFITNDVLLRPLYPAGTMLDTQHAVQMIREKCPVTVLGSSSDRGQVNRSMLSPERPMRARQRGQKAKPNNNKAKPKQIEQKSGAKARPLHFGQGQPSWGGRGRPANYNSNR